jgi:hypothetical protein
MLLNLTLIIIRYVAQFSRSLYVEYKSKGIDVQCQVIILNQFPWSHCSIAFNSTVLLLLVGPVLRGDRDGVPSRAAQGDGAVRAVGRRLRSRGGAVDRPRPALLPFRGAPGPVVPRVRRAGRRVPLGPPARGQAAACVHEKISWPGVNRNIGAMFLHVNSYGS